MYTHWPLMLCNTRGAFQPLRDAVAPQLKQRSLRPGKRCSGAQANIRGRTIKSNASLALISRSPCLSRCALTSKASWQGLRGTTQGSPRRINRPSAISRCTRSMYLLIPSIGSFGAGICPEAFGCAGKSFCRLNHMSNTVGAALGLWREG